VVTSATAEQYGPLLYGTTAVTAPDRLWSLANFGELITAPVTPLCWSVWHQGLETGSRAAYADFGVLAKSDVEPPTDPNGLLGACFAGRIALNIDFTRALMAAIPGASGDGFERDIVGKVRPGLPPDRMDLRRLPALVTKAPVLFLRAARNTTSGAQEMGWWWRHDVLDAPPAGDLTEAIARFDAALRRVRRAARCQAGSRFVVMAVQAQLVALCEQVGAPELANRIMSGLGDLPEARLADDLWLAGRGERTADDLRRSHGYYGVHIGNMTGRSWRQDPSLLAARIKAASSDTGVRRPRDRQHAAKAARAVAIERLLASASRVRRPLASKLARSSAVQFRALENGKAAVMMAVDGCRAAASEVGAALVASGRIERAEDVVFLRHEEFTVAGRADLRARIGERREVWAGFADVSVPTHFVGEPRVSVRPRAGSGASDRLAGSGASDRLAGSTGPDGDPVGTITGAAGSQGVAEGSVRLVADASGDIEPGEVLVCPFTDPSWTPLMVTAAAMVVDVGGPASHGAVVARELGIPCVIGTETAMTVLRDGDRVRVDGARGTVEVLAHG
jgi:pyruvate,water dikinase